jgi:hypothetical protein
MPVTYSIRSNLLLIVASGDYDAAEPPRTLLAALEDPACPPRVALLVDVRESRSLASRSMEEIRRIAEFVGPHAERIGGRCAVVTSSDLQFGLGRMGAAHAEGVGVNAAIFRDVAPALEWLGVPVAAYEH